MKPDILVVSPMPRGAMDALTVENLRLHFAGKPVKSPVYALP